MLIKSMIAMAILAAGLLREGYHPILQPYPFRATLVNATLIEYVRTSTACVQCFEYDKTRCDVLCASELDTATCHRQRCRHLCNKKGLGICTSCVATVLIDNATGPYDKFDFSPQFEHEAQCEEIAPGSRLVLVLDNTTGVVLDQNKLAQRVFAAYVLLLCDCILGMIWCITRSCSFRRRRRRSDVESGLYDGVVRAKVE